MIFPEGRSEPLKTLGFLGADQGIWNLSMGGHLKPLIIHLEFGFLDPEQKSMGAPLKSELCLRLD